MTKRPYVPAIIREVAGGLTSNILADIVDQDKKIVGDIRSDHTLISICVYPNLVIWWNKLDYPDPTKANIAFAKYNKAIESKYAELKIINT